MKRRIVLTGLGVVTSLARPVETLWSRLLAGDSGVGPISLFDVSGYRVQFAGQVQWDGLAEGVANVKELRRLDRFTQFAIAAAADAVRDSGIDFEKEEPYRCGVIIGSGIGGLAEFEAQHERLLKKGIDKVSPFTIPKLIVNAASGHVSSIHGIKGPNFAVATACASAANSLGEALRAIRYGDADVMVAGGSEAALTPMGLAGFQNMRALSFRSEAPQQASRPFDSDRDGFVLAEGAGVVVLEELEHAKARGAKIYGEIKGYGMSGDAHHITAPAEDGDGGFRAMQAALKRAGLAAGDIDYVNAHGTSTPLGDLIEAKAVARLLGDAAAKVSISSTKSATGHLLGAAGAIEAIYAIKTLQTGDLPPTLNLNDPEEVVADLDLVPLKSRNKKVRNAMSNSFGFGGTNASLIMGEVT